MQQEVQEVKQEVQPLKRMFFEAYNPAAHKAGLGANESASELGYTTVLHKEHWCAANKWRVSGYYRNCASRCMLARAAAIMHVLQSMATCVQLTELTD